MITLLALALGVAHANGPAQIRGADKIVWTGVDYTQARYVSTTDFQDEEKVSHYYPAQWNALVLNELLEPMAKGLGKTVKADVTFMQEHNQACTEEQILREEGTQPTLSEDQVAATVKTWTPKQTSGVGMGVVVERLVKLDEQGCGWLVFYDLSDKSVLYDEHFCEQAAGFGFRNFWFRPVKTILTHNLGPTMKQIKKQAR